MMAQPITTEPQKQATQYGMNYGNTTYNSQAVGPMEPPATGVQVQWMTLPIVAGCPPGLEYLSLIDQLIVKQEVELLEAITGWEVNNRYRVFNSVGQQVYFAEENSSCLMRQFCGRDRGFIINITDNMNRVVMRIVREFKCCAGCCWCACSDHCAFLVTVFDRDQNVLGYVRQSKSAWKPKYVVMTPEMEPVGHINGPCCVCHCPCCGDLQFPITDAGEVSEIGIVSKQWSGLAKEFLTDADSFSVSFPMNLDISMKATFMGALFLIDFMYFSKK